MKRSKDKEFKALKTEAEETIDANVRLILNSLTDTLEGNEHIIVSSLLIAALYGMQKIGYDAQKISSILDQAAKDLKIKEYGPIQ